MGMYTKGRAGGVGVLYKVVRMNLCDKKLDYSEWNGGIAEFWAEKWCDLMHVVCFSAALCLYFTGNRFGME